MFGIGNQELLIILLVVLVLFGGKRIPEVARGLGHGLREVRKAVRDVQREVDLEGLIQGRPEKPSAPPAPPAPPARGPAEEPRARDKEGGEGI